MARILSILIFTQLFCLKISFTSTVSSPILVNSSVNPAQNTGLELTSKDMIQLDERGTLTGKNVKIGMIVPGLKGWFEARQNQDIPQDFDPTLEDLNQDDEIDKVWAKDFGLGLFEDGEGTAMMEIIHDIAPDAKLYVTTPRTNNDYIAAIDWLQNKDVDIIISDIAINWDSAELNQYLFQGKGKLQQRVDKLVTEERVSFIMAAGNQQMEHYFGRFHPDEHGFHLYPNNKNSNTLLTNSSTSSLSFIWHKPAGFVDRDFDVYLMKQKDGPYTIDDIQDGSPLIAAKSDVEQMIFDGSDISLHQFQPYEYLSIKENSELQNKEFEILIHLKNSNSNDSTGIRFFIFNASSLETTTVERSIMKPGDALHAFTVGASHVDSFPLGKPEQSIIANYSSFGPSLSGYQRPDITAPANIITTTGLSGNFVELFPGTSAAAPHVAGVAALIMEASPGILPAQLYNVLRNSALPMEEYAHLGFPNNVCGYGLLNVPNAIQEAIILKEAQRVAMERIQIGQAIIDGIVEQNAEDDSSGTVIGNIRINDIIDVIPSLDNLPIIDFVNRTMQGEGDIYINEVDEVGTFSVLRGVFEMDDNSVFTPLENNGVFELFEQVYTYDFFEIGNEEDTDTSQSTQSIHVSPSQFGSDNPKVVTFHNGTVTFRDMTFALEEFKASSQRFSLFSAEVNLGGISFQASDISLLENRFFVDEFEGIFGNTGSITLNSFSMPTDGTELYFDSGTVQAGEVTIRLNNGFISSQAGIECSGGMVTGLGALGIEDFELPGFTIAEGEVSVTFDDPRTLLIAEQEATVDGFFKFSADEGIYFEHASIEIENQGTLSIDGLQIQNGILSIESGELNIPEIVNFSLNDLQISSEVFRIESAMAEFLLPNFPSNAIEVGFEIQNGNIELLREFELEYGGFQTTIAPGFKIGSNSGINIPSANIALYNNIIELSDILVQGEIWQAGESFIQIPGLLRINVDELNIGNGIIILQGAQGFLLTPGHSTLGPIEIPGVRIEPGSIEITFVDNQLPLRGFPLQLEGPLRIDQEDGFFVESAAIVIGGAPLARVNNLSFGNGMFSAENGDITLGGLLFVDFDSVDFSDERISITDGTVSILSHTPPIIIQDLLIENDSFVLTLPQKESIPILGFQFGIESLSFVENELSIGSGSFTAGGLIHVEFVELFLSENAVEVTEGTLSILSQLPVQIEQFLISQDELQITLPEDKTLMIAGLEFSIDQINASIDRSQDSPSIHSLSIVNPQHSTNVYDIRIDKILIEDGQFKFPPGVGGSIEISGLGSIGLTGMDVDDVNNNFRAESGTFSFENPSLDESFLAIQFMDLEVNPSGEITFSDAALTIADVFNAEFDEFEIIDGPNLYIEGAEVNIRNVGKKEGESALTAGIIDIGAGRVIVDDAGFELAGFEFDFGITHIPNQELGLDIFMKFPADRLPWPSVGGSIGLIGSPPDTRIVEFTLTVQGGTIPGTDLGINHLLVAYFEDGSRWRPDLSSTQKVFAGAGEFAIPGMFTVGLSAEFFNNCLNAFSVDVKNMNIAMGPSGVFFQDLGLGASGFCVPFPGPAIVPVYQIKWDSSLADGSFTADPTAYDPITLVEAVLDPTFQGGIFVTEDNAFRNEDSDDNQDPNVDQPPIDVQIPSEGIEPIFELPDLDNPLIMTRHPAFGGSSSSSVEDLDSYIICPLEVEVPGTERVIEFMIHIALTAGPTVNNKAFARLTADGHFDTTGWMLITGRLDILEFPVAGAEFELNPSGPNCGARLEMWVNILQILEGEAGVRIDCAKRVSGFISASIKVPKKIPIAGGAELAGVEAEFGPGRIAGEIRVLRIPFGFRFEEKKFKIGKAKFADSYDPGYAPFAFDDGYSNSMGADHTFTFMSNWEKVSEKQVVQTPGQVAPLQSSIEETYTITADDDHLIVVVQSTEEFPSVTIKTPDNSEYTQSPNDPNVLRFEDAITQNSEEIADNIVLLSEIEAHVDEEGINIPARVSYLIRSPQTGDYTARVVTDSPDTLIEFLVPNKPPTLQMGTTNVLNEDTITVQFLAFDPDSDAQIDLYLDSDLEGGDGIWVGSAIEDDGGGIIAFNPYVLETNSVSDPVVVSVTDWNNDKVVDATDEKIAIQQQSFIDSIIRPDTFAIPSGRYYPAAHIDDGSNATVIRYGEPITIINSNAPEQPQNVVVESTSGGLVVVWDGVDDPNGDLVGYKVLYSNDLNAINFDISVGVDIRNKAKGVDISNQTEIEKHSVFVPNLVNGHPYRLVVVAYDSKRNDSLMSEEVIGVPLSPDGLNAPNFRSNPPSIAQVGFDYTYQPIIRDLDFSFLNFELLNAPAGMIIDPTFGTVTYSPSMENVGAATVAIQVIDRTGLTDTQTYMLRTLAPIEDAEEIEGFPNCNLDQTVQAGERYTYKLRADCSFVSISFPDEIDNPNEDGESNQDNTPLYTFKLIEAPENMTLLGNGTVEWLTNELDEGIHRIAFEVVSTENQRIRSIHSFLLTVTAPVDYIPDASVGLPFPTPIIPPTPTPTMTPTPIPPIVLPENISLIEIIPLGEGSLQNVVSAEQIKFNLNGSLMYLLSQESQSIVAFQVDPISNRMKPNSLLTANDGVFQPEEMVITLNNAIITGNGDSTLTTILHDVRSGRMELQSTIDFGLGNNDIPDNIILAPKEQFLFSSVKEQNRIMVYNYDSASNALSFARFQSIDSGDPSIPSSIGDIDHSADGQYLYTLMPSTQWIRGFEINPTSGNLVFVSQHGVRTDFFKYFLVSPDGLSAIAVAENGEINTLVRNPASGELRPNTFLEGSSDLQIVDVEWSPDSSRIFILSQRSVFIFERTESFGVRLIETLRLNGVIHDIKSAAALAVDNNGKTLIVSAKENTRPGSLAVLDIGFIGQEIIPTPTNTPFLRFTPTPTRLPNVENTPTATSTPTPTPASISLDEERVSVLPLPGFEEAAKVAFGTIPTDNDPNNLSDGNGIHLTLQPGQGAFIPISETLEFASSLTEISVAARASSNAVQLALIAIAIPTDGSLGYVNPTLNEIPVDRWGNLRLVYQSPTGAFFTALQVVLPENATQEQVDVYLDSLQTKRFESQTSLPVPLTVDGDFETVYADFDGLNPNVFLPGGTAIGELFLVNGQSGQALQMRLTPEDTAIHVAPITSATEFPTFLSVSIDIYRQPNDDGKAMLAFLLTDGVQTAAYFARTIHFPIGVNQKIIFGGNFTQPEKPTTPLAILQIGGPGVSGDIVFDNLVVRSND